MVARNFSIQDISYSRLLQVPDDEREFLTLDELKPHHLTELGAQQAQEQQEQHQQAIQQHQHNLANEVQLINQNISQSYSVYYNLNSQTPKAIKTEFEEGMLPEESVNVEYCDLDSVKNYSKYFGQCGSIYIGGPATSLSSELPENALMISSSGISSMDASISNSSSLAITTNHNQHGHSHIHLHPHHHSPQSQNTNSMTGSCSRKRKHSYSEVSDLDDDDSKSVRTTDEHKKQNHSEIEKRRRDKMNTYITELSAMVPMCHAMSRKLDKLTVLRMAVQHLKTIRGAVHSYTEGLYKPAFLSDQELKMLILQAAEGFLFVVGCDRGRILYVSESVSQILNYSQGDLLGQSWFDILHPKDVAKVKEQLSSSDLSPRERLIDAKTMLPVKTDVPQGVSRLCPGARRSFFCRMKYKNPLQVKEENDMSQNNCHRRKKQMTDKKFCVVQCTGYLKSWAPAKIGVEEQDTTDGESESCNLSCLVAVGRLQPNIFQNGFNSGLSNKLNGNSNNNGQNHSNSARHNPNLRNIQFISRHAMDGKFLFVDQRATLVLGFLPQELLGTSMYEYYHHDDITGLAESHKVALQSNEKVTTSVYRLRTKDNGFINVQSEWKSFKNPWTKDSEYLIAKNNVILSDLRHFDNNNQQLNRSDSVENNYDFFNQSNGREMQRMINTHIEASKIGRQIADEVLDFQRRLGDFSSDSSPDPDPTLAQTVPLLTENPLISSVEINLDRRSSGASTSQTSAPPRLNGTLPSYNQVRNNAIVSPENATDAEMIPILHPHEPPVPTADGNGNDEAAMAVIMSLLEADAGLGDNPDFSGLPWPLP